MKILLLILALVSLGMLRPGSSTQRAPQQQPLVWRIFFSTPMPRTRPFITISTFFHRRNRIYETIVDNALLPLQHRVVFEAMSQGYPRAMITHDLAVEWAVMRFGPRPFQLPPPPALQRQRRLREPVIEAPTEQNSDNDENQD